MKNPVGIRPWQKIGRRRTVAGEDPAESPGKPAGTAGLRGMAGLTVRVRPAGFDFPRISLASAGNHDSGFGQDLWSVLMGLALCVLALTVTGGCFEGAFDAICFLCDLDSAGCPRFQSFLSVSCCRRGLLWRSDSCPGCGTDRAAARAVFRASICGSGDGSVLWWRIVAVLADVSGSGRSSSGLPCPVSLLQLQGSMGCARAAGPQSFNHVVNVLL